MAKKKTKTLLTLGPLLFNWPVEKWRDFYARMADEAPLDRVYLGEVVCSKRQPLFEKHYGEAADRLMRGGKEVVRTTLAEVMLPLERKQTKAACAAPFYADGMVEANDTAALYHLRGRPHAVGPLVNCYNEETLAVLAADGAVHVTLPFELPGTAIGVMAAAAARLGVTTEVMVHGRVPLALSARCYHARAHGRIKDNCRYVCENDPDGMVLKTLDGDAFLAVNGIQTLSHTCLNLVQELPRMAAMGISAFRLSPHTHDQVQVAQIFRRVLDGALAPSEALPQLAALGFRGAGVGSTARDSRAVADSGADVPDSDHVVPDSHGALPFANGFYHGEAGVSWCEVG